jgi:hypothetical protein
MIRRKNMRGKVKMVFLALVMVALAGAAQADSLIFPVGWTLNYSAQEVGGDSWTSTLSFINPTTMKMINWDSPVQNVSATVQLTSDTFSLDEGQGLQPYFKLLAEGANWTFTGDDGYTVTATVKGIINGFTVPAGTFNNVYWVYYKSEDEYGGVHMNEDFYWKPGLGLIKTVDYGMNPVTTHTLTSYATPIPPGFLLLGSGLMGLAFMRRFRMG